MSKKTKNDYVNDYVLKKIVVFDNVEKKYTIPKLYIPKGKDNKPTVAKGKYWYVYYYYKNPQTNTFNWNSPITIKAGINRRKTVKERKTYGQKIIAELLKLLEEGFCPYVNTEFVEQQNESFTISEALNYAIKNKSSELKARTIEDYKDRKNEFERWLKLNNLQFIPVQEINKRHISSFLNHVNTTTSNRNTNNYKAALSSLFSKLVKDGIIDTNIVISISKRKTTPTKHKAFLEDELKAIKTYLLKNDPYLYKYMVFMAYSFLRPVEASRIQLKHIDLKNSIIRIETKTEKLASVVIIDKLKPIIESFELHKYKSEDYLFTPAGTPGPYEVRKESYRSNYFSKRFTKVRDHLNLSSNHTVYGLRHTFAVDIYNGFLAKGFNERETILKMLPITRHKNETSLRNYLRSVDAFITKDYSDNITTDF
jgi:integrase